MIFESSLAFCIDCYTCRQQAFDNLGDDLCQKNADMIKRKLIKLEEEINESLTEIRYELVEILDR